MKTSSEKISISVAVILVILLTFMPHDVQKALIDHIENILSHLMELFLPSAIFDTRLFVSNLGHLMIFCILGYVAGRVFKRKSISHTFSFLIILAIGSEISQFFVSGREPSLSDLIINISAVSAGFLISIQRHRSRRRSLKSHSFIEK